MTGLTREFSICLTPDQATTDAVMQLRGQLPASPYRDDEPHITLLRGIQSPALPSDEALVADLESTIRLTDSLPLAATTESVGNESNRIYSTSSLIALQPSPALLDYRQNVISGLLSRGYSVEQPEIDSYRPHITIRLGVPVEGKTLEEAQQLFEGKTYMFSDWLLLRLEDSDGPRSMHEVRPGLVS